MASDNQTTRNVIALHPKSYSAKLHVLHVSGFDIHIAGTLDGLVDLAIITSNGKSRTYNLTCDDARALIAALHSAVSDVQQNCLFDRDPLLMKD